MKQFIVSIAIIILGTAGLIFGDDLTRYVLIEQALSDLTEECACYAAWGLEKTDEGVGISRAKAINNVRELVNYYQRIKPWTNIGELIFDPSDLEVDPDSKRIVTVSLSFKADNRFFRSKIVEKSNILRWSSSYEWK